MRQSLQRATGLAGVLRAVVADMQSASGADIVSIFLYEESTRRYYAPFATGQPQESLLDSLADMTEQLGRYADDASQGKVPDDLGVHNYGSTVWLTVTRRPPVARDAPAGDKQADIKELRRVLSIALADLLLASELDAAAIYQFAPHRTSLELVTAHAPVAAPVHVERGNHDTWEEALSAAVALVTAPS